MIKRRKTTDSTTDQTQTAWVMGGQRNKKNQQESGGSSSSSSTGNNNGPKETSSAAGQINSFISRNYGGSGATGASSSSRGRTNTANGKNWAQIRQINIARATKRKNQSAADVFGRGNKERKLGTGLTKKANKLRTGGGETSIAAQLLNQDDLFQQAEEATQLTEQLVQDIQNDPLGTAIQTAQDPIIQETVRGVISGGGQQETGSERTSQTGDDTIVISDDEEEIQKLIRRQEMEAENNDQDVAHLGPAGLLAATTGGTDPQTGRAGGGTNANAFKPMLPAPKLYSTPYLNSTNFRVVRNTLMLCYAFGATDPDDALGPAKGQQVPFPSTPGNVNPTLAGPWFAWMQGDHLNGPSETLRETIIRSAPMFSSRQYRLWSLQLNTLNATESGFARWGILTNLGAIHKTLSEAKEKQTPGINWGKMRVGNFKMIVLPFQNQSTLPSKQDQNIPNQAPPPRLHMAVKYVTTNKYSVHAERGEQGDSLVQKTETYAEHWKKAVLTPLMSEPASTVIDAGDETTVIPIDIEYQKTFSIATQAATQYTEWKRGPWFESEDNVLV